MRWIIEAAVIAAITLAYQLIFDAPIWGALIGGYVFWLYVEPKRWRQ